MICSCSFHSRSWKRRTKSSTKCNSKQDDQENPKMNFMDSYWPSMLSFTMILSFPFHLNLCLVRCQSIHSTNAAELHLKNSTKPNCSHAQNFTHLQVITLLHTTQQISDDMVSLELCKALANQNCLLAFSFTQSGFQKEGICKLAWSQRTTLLVVSFNLEKSISTTSHKLSCQQ